MNDIDRELESMTQKIRKAGGIAGIDTDAPDHVKRAWLDMILNCPDCKAELEKSDGKGA